MSLLFHPSVWTKGNLKNEWKNCVNSVLAWPKTCTQTPRHSSTNHIKKQGTINSKVKHWDYTTLITTMTVIFTEYGILCILSDAGTNFVSDTFKKFCSSLNIEQAVSSVYHHQSNGQAEACIKFTKCTLKNVPILGRT